MSVHVYPLGDLIDHQTESVDGSDCLCEPQVEWLDEETGLPYEGGPLVIHNAIDGREK